MASVVVACPKCQTRLKLSKAPSEAARVNCPHCHHQFGVAPTATTAQPPQPQIQAKPPAPRPPMPRPQVASAAPRPLVSRGMGAGIIAAVVLVGGGCIGAYLYHNRPATEVAAKPEEPKEKVQVKKHEHKKEKDIHPKKVTPAPKRLTKDELLTRAKKNAGNKRFLEALADYNHILAEFKDDQEALSGKQDAEEALKAEVDSQKKLAEDKLKILLAQGDEALTKKDFDKAADFFTQALTMAADNADAFKGLRSAIEGQAQAGQQKQLADAEEKKKADFKMYMVSAQKALDAGRYLDAISDASSAKTLYPDSVEALALLEQAGKGVTMLSTLKGDDEKKKAFDTIIEQATGAMNMKKFDEAVQAYTEALKLFPDDDGAKKGLAMAQAQGQQMAVMFQQLVAQGVQLYGMGNFPDAINSFGAALKLYPADLDARAKLAMAQQALVLYQAKMQGQTALLAKQYLAAMTAYGNALSLSPNDPEAQLGFQTAQQLLAAKQIVDYKLQQAQVCLALLQFPAAKQLLDEAIVLFPGHPDIASTTAWSIYAGGMIVGPASVSTKDYGQAVSAYLAAEGARPNFNNPLLAPMDPWWVLAEQGRLQALTLGLAANTDGLNKGKQAMAARRYRDAINNYTDAVRAIPNDAVSLFNNADLNNRLQLALAGQAQATQAAQQRFNDDIAKGNQAMAAMNYKAAVAAFSDALLMFPNDQPTQASLANAQQLLANQGTTQPNPANTFTMKIQIAEKLLIQKNYPAASKAFADAIGVQPTDPQVPGLKNKAAYADAMGTGVSAMNLKNFKSALAAYNAALAALPGDALALQGKQAAQAGLDAGNLAKDFEGKVKLAGQSLTTKNYDQAAAQFKELTSLKPADPRAGDWQNKANFAGAMVRAHSAMSAKQFADALTAYQQAVALIPADATANKGVADARAQLNMGNVAAKQFEAKVGAAEQALAAKNYSQAAKHFNELANLKSGDPRAGDWQNKATFAGAMVRAHAAMKTKQYSDAHTAYKQAAALLPGDAAAQKGVSDAEQALQQQTAGNQAKQKFDAHVKQADKYLNAKNYQLASAAYREAIKLMPADGQVNALQQKAAYAHAMGQAHAAMTKKNYKAAADAYESALTANPGDLTATMGKQEAQQRQAQAAAAAQARQNFDNKMQQAEASIQARNYADAAMKIHEALKIMPNGAAQTRLHYAEAMAKGHAAMMPPRNLKEARLHFQQALNLVPGDPAATAALANAKKAK